jgi:hypothetical protein
MDCTIEVEERSSEHKKCMGRKTMEVTLDILEHPDGVMTLDAHVPVAPHSIGGNRCKVYRALLSLETDRFSVALAKNNALLFPKSSRREKLLTSASAEAEADGVVWVKTPERVIPSADVAPQLLLPAEIPSLGCTALQLAGAR